jgi:hypothetical protein
MVILCLYEIINRNPQTRRANKAYYSRYMYVFSDTEANFACWFYHNYKFSVTQKNVYTLAAKSFNILEIVLPQPQAASATMFLSVR